MLARSLDLAGKRAWRGLPSVMALQLGEDNLTA